MCDSELDFSKKNYKLAFRTGKFDDRASIVAKPRDVFWIIKSKFFFYFLVKYWQELIKIIAKSFENFVHSMDKNLILTFRPFLFFVLFRSKYTN